MKIFYLYAYILVIVFVWFDSAYYVEGKLKTKINLDDVEVNINKTGPIVINLTFSKFNRTHMMVNANGSTSDTVDKSYKFTLEVQFWGDGGWKKNFINYVGEDPCKQLKTFLGPSWNDLIRAAKLNEKCPYYAGEYRLDNFIVNIAECPLAIKIGKFKIIVNLYKFNVWILQVIFYATITEYN